MTPAEDRQYVHTLQSQAAPTALSAVARLNGYRIDRSGARRRYLDLGCGTGFHLCLMAATNPAVEFVGVDYLASHVEAGRRLADAAGLENVTFAAESFAALKRYPEMLGTFDFAMAHGVLSWIDDHARGDLIDLLGAILRPGALLYLGYNAMPGWAAIEPLRYTVRKFAHGKTGAAADAAVRQAFDLFERFRRDGVGVMADSPALAAWLDDNAGQEADYLWHEYLATDARAFWRDEVSEMLGAVRLRYVGSARVAENVDPLNFNGALLDIVRTADGDGHGQLVRDLAGNRYFATDVYALTPTEMDGPEMLETFDGMEVAALRPPPSGVCGSGAGALDRAILGELMLGSKNSRHLGNTLGRPLAEIRARVLALVASGVAGFALASPQRADPDRVARFNRAALQLDGCPGLAVSLIGGGLPFHDWLQEIVDGHDDMRRTWLSELAPGSVKSDQ